MGLPRQSSGLLAVSSSRGPSQPDTDDTEDEMYAREIMTRHIVTIGPEATLKEAIHRLNR
jgi:hypothetical protein